MYWTYVLLLQLHHLFLKCRSNYCKGEEKKITKLPNYTAIVNLSILWRLREVALGYKSLSTIKNSTKTDWTKWKTFGICNHRSQTLSFLLFSNVFLFFIWLKTILCPSRPCPALFGFKNIFDWSQSAIGISWSELEPNKEIQYQEYSINWGARSSLNFYLWK